MSECKIGPSSASYIYTELWDHNETNQQVASYLQGARDKSANKPQIVAAYAGDFYQGGNAVTFTIDAGQGGTVTLVTRYARQGDDPAYHQMILDMGQPTQKLIKYVHFDTTGSYDTWKEMTETVELTPGVHTISFWVPGDQTYTPVNIDCMREFNSDSIKLADAAFAANGAHHLRILPFDNTSVTYHLEEGEAVTGQVRNDLGQCLTIPGDTTQEGTQAVISQCSSSSPSQRCSLPSPTGNGPSGASELHSGGLREVGQSGHELRNHLAVASVLHEVGQTLGRAGDLNDGAALGGNKTGDDVLAPGHHAHRGVEGDNLTVGVGERHGRLRNGLRGRDGELEQLLERHVELECLRRGMHTHGSISLKISVISDARDRLARAPAK